MSKYNYVVLHNTGTLIEGVKRPLPLTMKDENTDRLIRYDDCWHAYKETFSVDASKFETDPSYANYFISLENAGVIAREDAKYKNGAELTISDVKGKYTELSPTLEAKKEVEEFYTSLVDKAKLEEYAKLTEIRRTDQNRMSKEKIDKLTK